MPCLICDKTRTALQTLPKGGKFCVECSIVSYPSKGRRPEHDHFCHDCQGVWHCMDADCKLPLEWGCDITTDKCCGIAPFTMEVYPHRDCPECEWIG